ncbi:hypothetical protein [Desulfovibrio sp. Huiquan2017]|uniref:hypothetical protein n=1 Tax=Desulfovibrio sp. Huiquan2017 TaxID=2816861 RepID=UPI001A930941|nr:hypothetical protein [Desulfovibrio sp. Huiquan2017]
MGSKRRIIKTDDGASVDATGFVERYLLVDEQNVVQATTDTRGSYRLSTARPVNGIATESPDMQLVFFPHMINAVFPDMPDDDKREMYRRTSAVLVAAGAMDGVAMIEDMIVAEEIYQ